MKNLSGPWWAIKPQRLQYGMMTGYQQPRSESMGDILPPVDQAAYDQSMQTIQDKLFQVPGVKEAITAQAEQEFLNKWAGVAIVGSLLGLTMAFALGRASK